VPVRHVGGRWGVDGILRSRAYSGYVFEYHGLSVYFGGDTAFDPDAFRATREHFPSLDLAILPICPIAPRDFMQHTHMDPIEALEAFRLLGARRMIPVHFDTFINSDDQRGDCPRALREAMKRRGVADDAVELLAIGEERVVVPR
jgi:L-ascorbate metabolism protein UlaG (beta-lactamase superfamily)